MKTEEERWKDIPEFEGLYQVSNLGRVRSVDHLVRVVPHPGTEALRLSPGRLLKPGTCNRQGHCSVAIGKGNSQMVHSLVALAFIGPRPPKHDVAHLNGVGADNRLENLAYVTRSENNRHVVFHGRRDLSVEMVEHIRLCAAMGFRYGEKAALAKQLGISPTQLSSVLHGRLYAHV